MNLKLILGLNAINLVMALLIAVIHFLFPPPASAILAVLWFAWTALSNYKLVIRDHDVIRNFDRHVRSLDRKYQTAFYPRYADVLIRNHRAIEEKQDFFLKQPENIQKAYELILKKSVKYLDSATAYLDQYDFIRQPQPEHMTRLCLNSNELVRKLHELSEDCFKIQDAASDVDISVIDDLLASLDAMQDT